MRFRLAPSLPFIRNQHGIAVVEFALALPFLLLLFLGGVEVTRFILMNQKVEKISATIADLTAQQTNASTSALSALVVAASEVMSPYPFTSNGVVVVSSVYQNGPPTVLNVPKVNWQYKGGGTLVRNSKIGANGANAVLPNGFTMVDKENIIIAEVYYQYVPLLKGVTPQTDIYRRSIFRPRLGAMTSLGS